LCGDPLVPKDDKNKVVSASIVRRFREITQENLKRAMKTVAELDWGHKELRRRNMGALENNVASRLRKAKYGVQRLNAEFEESDRVFNDGLKKAESEIKKRIGELEERRANLEDLQGFLNELIKV